MATHVALLRGINVGGRNRIAMADLREVVAALGHTGVATYIQSGNVVFTTEQSDRATLTAGLERAIAARLGVKPRVLVLSCDELAQVVAANPYPDEVNPRLLHAIFLSEDPSPDVVESVATARRQAAAKGSRDSAVVVGRTIFLLTPDGFGRSELASQLLHGRRGDSAESTATSRNWATVTKLRAICDAR